MPKCKLYYFQGRGRVEPVRLWFAATGVEYEDIRLPFEEWLKKKAEGFSPVSYLPVLEVDGKRFGENIAILRFLARYYDQLYPSDSFEVGMCDQICYAFFDLLEKMVEFFYEQDKEVQKSLKKIIDETLLPEFLKKMTSLLKSNKDGKGFFVGDKLSYADLVMFHCCDMPLVSVEEYPELKAHYCRIGEIPGIKEWVKKRPVE